MDAKTGKEGKTTDTLFHERYAKQRPEVVAGTNYSKRYLRTNKIGKNGELQASEEIDLTDEKAVTSLKKSLSEQPGEFD
jgi:hypothetical protein